MAYSYTERKRIRKSFGSRENVLEIPYLLQMQKDAYTAFLQAGAAPKKRANEGLQAAFLSAFPIVSHNGFVEISTSSTTWPNPHLMCANARHVASPFPQLCVRACN